MLHVVVVEDVELQRLVRLDVAVLALPLGDVHVVVLELCKRNLVLTMSMCLLVDLLLWMIAV